MSTGAIYLFFCGSILLAQTPNASLIGTVSDGSGALIASATIQLTNLGTKVEKSTLSSGLGAYQFSSLQPGRYRIEFSATKFKTHVATEVVFRVGDERRMNVILQPGEARDSITVEGDAPLIETERATASSVVNERAIQELPLNGRQLQNLALFVPGVSGGWNLSTASNRYGKARENTEGAFNINGARSRSNSFIFDGMPMIIRQYSVINFEPSNEAVQEFEVKSSLPPAEFGRTMGGVVSIITRAGSAAFHGSGYEFFRNDRLDSNSTFNTAAGIRRGKVRQNQFGGSLGGPIWKKSHFFFVNTEFLRNLESTETRLTSVATPDERRGLIPYTAAGGSRQVLDLSNRITPLSAKLLSLYPEPNAGLANGPNYNAPLPIGLNDYQFHIRTDHHLTPRDLLTLRTSWNLNDQVYIIYRFSGPFIPNFPLVNPERTTNGTLAHSHTFSASVLNEARLGVNRYGNLLGNGDQTNAETFGLPHGATANGIPFITFTPGSIENIGGPGGNGREQNELTVFASDALSVLRGRHSVKIGGDVTRLHYNTRGANNQRGTLLFDGTRNGLLPAGGINTRANVLADLILGLPQQASITVGQFGRGYRQWAYAFFAQDSWRVTPKLTLSYGLRYEYSAPWTEVNSKLANLEPGSGSLITPGSANWQGLYRPDRNNFSPRFGFAYNVGGNARTVIRGGYALLYETLMQSSIVQPLENNPPFSAAAVTFSPTPFATGNSASNTLLDLRRSAVPSRSIAAVPQNLSNPYSMQFTLNIQRSFANTWLTEIGYQATRGVGLAINYNRNQVPIASLSTAQREIIARAGANTAAIIDLLRPYPAFNTINYFTNTAQSIYHGFHFNVEKRLSAGLNMLAAYTWSKSIDNASDYNSSDSSERVANSYLLRAQRGASSFDIPHRFTTAVNYRLPFHSSNYQRLTNGWQVNGNITFQSGQPFTPYTSVNDPFRNETFNFLDVVGNPLENIPAGRAYNPAAFRTPAPGTFGVSGRNIVRGDNFQSVDVSLFKTTAITEHLMLQLRLEAINSLNHVNYQGPVTNQAASNPGAFISSATPRVVQLGAKLTF